MAKKSTQVPGSEDFDDDCESNIEFDQKDDEGNRTSLVGFRVRKRTLRFS